MPEIFLGKWYHNEGYLHLTVNADGTMTDIYPNGGDQLIREIQYKILYVYDPEKVAILYKKKHHEHHNPDFYRVWRKPKFSVVGLHRAKDNRNSVRFDWTRSCDLASEEEWENIDQYRDVLVKRMVELHPKCLSVFDGFPGQRFWPVGERKFP